MKLGVFFAMIVSVFLFFFNIFVHNDGLALFSLILVIYNNYIYYKLSEEDGNDTIN